MKCVCYNKTIEKIIEKARKKSLTSVEQISKMIGCCDKCCLCVPIIEKILKK